MTQEMSGNSNGAPALIRQGRDSANCVVFIDARVPDIGQILAGISEDAIVYLLDASTNGVAQIEAALAGATDLESVHIVSHGSSGTLYLGSTVLTAENLSGYQGALASIGAALSGDGDLLLYGCDVGAGAAGQAFIQTLAQYTGADVAASVDRTGSTALGGDWMLEASTGAIEATAFHATDYGALLAPPVLTAAGTLDTSFSGDGIVTTAIGAGDDQISSMAQQRDGKIVAAGWSSNGANTDFALARYNPDGSLDATFSGDGKLTTAVGTGDDQISSIAILADGRIVVGGWSSNGTSADFALARYNFDGSPDTSFGGDGEVTTSVGAGAEQISGIALQADGRVVAAGWSSNGANTDFALARYNADGSLDTNFGTDGKVVTNLGGDEQITGVVMQGDKIVVAGYVSVSWNEWRFALARYNTDGTLDTTFGSAGTGTVTTNFFPLQFVSQAAGYSMALDSDDRILVAGIAGSYPYDFALARYTAHGDLDGTFSGDGIQLTEIGGVSVDFASAIALQPDGRIVLTGRSSGVSGFYDLAVARYDPDGSLDSGFGGDGTLVISLSGAYDDALQSVLVQGDGAIVAAGSVFDGSANDFALIRLNSGLGIPDVSAGTHGEFEYTFNANTFVDPDGGALTYSAELQGGGLLPDWLSFDPATRTFTGTPESTGTVNVIVTATDSELPSVSDSFAITVQANDAPYFRIGLDTNFDGDGRVTTTFGASGDRIFGMTLQADGKIVVVGQNFPGGVYTNSVLARYNPDGSLDATFSGDGKVVDDLYIEFDELHGVAMQADGKIVAVGAARTASYSISDFLVARYNPDGSPDSTFDGDGSVATSVGEGADGDGANAVAVQPEDQKIVVVGQTGASFALVRYNPDGSLDSTFGNGGSVVPAEIGFGQSVALDSEGRIVVAGHTSGNDFVLARYNPDGNLDLSFSGDGWTTASKGGSGPVSVALQFDGKILVSGHNGASFALVRFNANGDLDGGFGAGGSVTTPMDVDGSNGPRTSVALQSDGRIVLGGSSGSEFGFARYNPDGSPDLTFDGDGKLVVGIGELDVAASMAIQDDGAIVAAGYAQVNFTDADFAALRIAGGVADQVATEDAPFVLALGADLAIDPDGDPLFYGAGTRPAWLDFNPVTRTFAGTPAQEDVGFVDVQLVASDIWNASVTDTFRITVGNANDAPVLAHPLADRTTPVNTDFSYTIPAGMFDDVDDGDTLTYSAALANGALLPTWLSINSSTGEISGNAPDSEFLQSYDIRITATDSGNVSASGVFRLTMNAGSAGPDMLEGNSGNNTIDGGGGADVMRGLQGDDTYVVDDADDEIVEAFSAGAEDKVEAWVSYTLPDNVETLQLLGGSPINGTGNFQINQIFGNNAANVLDGGFNIDLLRGGLGDDTYVVDSAGDQVIEASGANTGTDTIRSTVGYVLPDNVENITLTGIASETATGNALANVVTGNPGHNMLDGGLGADSMLGKLGDDTYIVDNVGDTITELASEGADLVRSSVTWTLGANVEHMILTGTGNINGTGNTLSNQLIGNIGNNILTGGAGDDLLKGGDNLNGASGADTLIGGLGNDTYYIDSADDTVTELAGGGTEDKIYTTVSIETALFANVERVQVVDVGAFFIVGNGLNNIFIGGDGNDTLRGEDGNDELFGLAGNDTLEGGAGDDKMEGGLGNDTLKGDAGADTMTGGLGADTYYVDDLGDVVVETDNTPSGGQGFILSFPDLGSIIDTIETTIRKSLVGIDFVENLRLAMGAGNLNATGNGLDNVLEGNEGDNVLDGGSSILRGDTASYAQALGSVAVSLAVAGPQATGGAGTDTLIGIENLTGGAFNDTLAGDGNANVLDGGAGNDTLNGGVGADTMFGGLGNDTYVVNSTADVVTEAASAGTDRVQSTAAHSLSVNVENLTLTGTAAINGTGNTGSNVLTGNTGKNVLTGNSGNDTLNGGLGNDTLNGGSGTDAFLFSSALGAANIDRVTGYSVADDTIRLENAIFTSLVTPGALAAGSFRAGAGLTAAADANDFIIYNISNGQLFYDAGGNTGAASKHFATLTGVAGVVTAADFLIV